MAGGMCSQLRPLLRSRHPLPRSRHQGLPAWCRQHSSNACTGAAGSGATTSQARAGPLGAQRLNGRATGTKTRFHKPRSKAYIEHSTRHSTRSNPSEVAQQDQAWERAQHQGHGSRGARLKTEEKDVHTKSFDSKLQCQRHTNTKRTVRLAGRAQGLLTSLCQPAWHPGALRGCSSHTTPRRV